MGHLGRSNASRPPTSRSRGGGRGRGKPLPEGEEGGWKRKLPRPPTPRGLVGFLVCWIFLNLLYMFGDYIFISFIFIMFGLNVSIYFCLDFDVAYRPRPSTWACTTRWLRPARSTRPAWSPRRSWFRVTKRVPSVFLGFPSVFLRCPLGFQWKI